MYRMDCRRLEMKQNNLWERQLWDSDTSFAVFQIWLKQDFRPRNLDKAWRTYLGKDRDKSGKLIHAPTAIHHAYHATDNRSKKYPHSVDWPTRAAAFDAATAQEELEMWQHRRQQIRRQEWASAEALLEKAREMLEWPLYIRYEDGGKTIIQPVRWSIRDIQLFLKTASELSRLAAEMETSRAKVEMVFSFSEETIQAMRELDMRGIPSSMLVKEFEAIIQDAARKVRDADRDS